MCGQEREEGGKRKEENNWKILSEGEPAVVIICSLNKEKSHRFSFDLDGHFQQLSTVKVFLSLLLDSL